MLYDGDLHDHQRVMNWLTSQDVFEIKNEIEEVNRKMLNKLLDENEFLAVYFCKFPLVVKFDVFPLLMPPSIPQSKKTTPRVTPSWRNSS